MIELRPATGNDIAAVLAFWNAATAEPSSTDDADGIAALLAQSPEALILALDDDVIVGTIVAGWDGWRGSLYRLAVAPSHRRRGIATSLVLEAERVLAPRCSPHASHRRTRGRPGGRGVLALRPRYEPTDQIRMVKNLGHASVSR